MLDACDHRSEDTLRVEDPPLLTGAGAFIDDLGTPPGTLHAAILRAPHAHALIEGIDVGEALTLPGVSAVLTGDDVRRLSRPLMVGVKAPIEAWPLAVGKVRYAGEPVAVVVAESRYVAEDALDLIHVSYRRLPPVMDPERALADDAPALHERLDSNLASERHFRYGDPEAAFARAAHEVAITVRYPRNAVTPIETYGVVAQYDPHEDAYDVLANFQGPFSIHAVLSRALDVPGNRLRLRTPPDSGGSFGIKQGVFPYIVLMALAARVAGAPVKWIEDRLEHLTASVSATNRVATLRAAVEADGRVTALDLDQIEDVGACLRAPEPATLYRMHGNYTGAYAIPNLAIRNRLVMTNKTPTGLNRGFGGPQMYFALERLMRRIALELGLDPLDVIRRNLIPADAFPYTTASGAQYDSGDYQTAVATALEDGGYAALLERREAARAEGRLYGIGLAAVVEPSVSNMGYLSTALTPEERAKAGPKNGAQAAATIDLDPTGAVSVQLDSVPQGQGHRTVAARLVADILGIDPNTVRVIAEFDTAKDAWSIAAGNYSSRFAAASVGAVKIAAERLRDRLARIAATQLNAPAEAVVFEDGRIFAEGNPDNAVPFARVASASHWAPGTLPDGMAEAIRETAFWTPPELAAPTPEDGINSSLCHAFIFDFCGIEIDRTTGQVHVDRYVTMHDCGRVLHAGMVEGQIRGAYANAIGATFYEEYAYGDDGAFLAGTFADYPVPTAMEVSDPLILHIETPSPVTPTGAKGVGEGNCMSTPVCLANGVADALGSEADLVLPLSPARLMPLIGGEEPQPPAGAAPRPEPASGGRTLTGSGSAQVAASPQDVWEMLLDPQTLKSIIPGCHAVEEVAPHIFRADVTLGVGPVKGRYIARVALRDLDPPNSVLLEGEVNGALGTGGGTGHVTLTPAEGGTTLAYRYEAEVGGKVASVGGRLLDGAAKIVIGQFFEALGRQAGGAKPGLLARLFGGRS